MLASHDENTIDDDELLTGTGSGGVFTSGYLRDRPLIEYLGESERVGFLLSNAKKGVRKESDSESVAYTPGDGYQAIAAITDTRVLFVVGDGDEEGDAEYAVPYTEIEDVKTDRGVLTKRLDVWTTSGTRWRFYVRSSVDIEPAAEYVDMAAVVWSRVESQLQDARQQVVAIDEAIADRRFADARTAGERAGDHVEEARRMAAELTGNRDDAVWERVLDAEERLDAARMRAHRKRAEHATREAERQWRQELYNQAYESYEDAREGYERALDVARDQEFPDVADLVDEVESVRQNLDHLSKSPLRRAEETRDRAREVEDSEVAVDLWEDALERYQTALVLGWGSDDRRFAGDSDEIRAEIETVVDRLVATRRDLATRHRQAGNWYDASQQYERAHEQYSRARDHVEEALTVAEELRPGLVDGLEADVAALDDLVADALEKASRAVFDFVGDGRDGTDPVDAEPTDRQSGERADAEGAGGDVLDRLVALDGDAFRRVVADAWQSMGWTTTLLSGDGDGTVDVVATRQTPEPATQLLVTAQVPRNVEFKRSTVEEATATSEAAHDPDAVTFVTTGAFTDDARAIASETPVELVDGDALASILEAEGLTDRVTRERRQTAD